MNKEMESQFLPIICRWAKAIANIERSGPKEAMLWIGVEHGIDHAVFELSLCRFDGFGFDEYKAVRDAATKMADELLDGSEK